MIEIILKRKPIRDFLKNYSSERWTEIIPAVMKIDILNLILRLQMVLFQKVVQF